MARQRSASLFRIAAAVIGLGLVIKIVRGADVFGGRTKAIQCFIELAREAEHVELQPSATYRAPSGMVCAIDHLAAGAGAAMLRQHGNAADAAIATSAVLAVTSQHLCGLGGDLLAIVTPPGENPVVLNATGRSGSGADPDRLRRAGHRAMPFRDDISTVTVPGCVDGWLALHARFGRLPLETVLEPARHYAVEGFPISPTLAAAIANVAHLDDAADYTSTSMQEGSLVRRAGVGRTLQAIVDGGRDAFYQGEFGANLIAIGNGEFVEEDLRERNVEWTDAISVDAFGARVWSAPPNSQGYLTLASAFIVSGLDLPTDPHDGEFVHLLVESARLAGYDRLDVLADGVDPAKLLAEPALLARRAAIDRNKAAVLGEHYRDGDTVAVCAVDCDQLGVTLMQSNASGFGAHIVVPGVRIFLHNRGIGFSLEPGHRAEYGPRRRPVSTLCPTAVTSLDGRLRGVVGTMGGDGQPQTLLQVLTRWLHCGQPPGDALAAGRFVLSDDEAGGNFATWNKRGQVEVTLEGHAPLEWDAALCQRGHSTSRIAPYSAAFGHVQLIEVTDHGFAGATDPRTRGGIVAAL